MNAIARSSMVPLVITWSRSMQLMPSPLRTKPRPTPAFDLVASVWVVQVSGFVELAGVPSMVSGILFAVRRTHRLRSVSSRGIGFRVLRRRS